MGPASAACTVLECGLSCGTPILFFDSFLQTNIHAITYHRYVMAHRETHSRAIALA